MADDAPSAASAIVETTVVEQTVVTESAGTAPATDTVIAESPAPSALAKAISPAPAATEEPSSSAKDADASGDAKPSEEKKTEAGESAASASAPAAEESKDEPAAAAPSDDATAAEESKSEKPDAAAAQTPARKKSISRRKSNANLKKTPKKPAEEKSFAPGDLVLTRLKGYPAWPSIVLNEELLPEFMKKGPGMGKRTTGDGMSASAWKTQFPVFFLGSYDYSWASISDIDVLTDELREAGPARKMKKLPEAYEQSKNYTLEDVKQHQSEAMEIDEEEPEEMDVDEEEEEEEAASEEEPKPKKRGTKRKKTESASDDEEVSPKPAKTPKKAAAPKEKTPKTKTPKTKTPKSAANGVKASAKKGAAKKDATPAAKRGGKKKGVKSAEYVEDSGAESAPEDSEDQADKLVDAQNLGDEEKHKVMMGRRHRMQKCLLNKEGTEPSEKEMVIMDRYLESLESWDPISAELITSTKIHKVLRNIVKKKEEIPCDAQYSFRTRCKQLHDKWVAIIKEAGPEADDEGGASGEKKVTKTVPTQDVIKEHAEKEGEKENGVDKKDEGKEEAAAANGEEAAKEKKDDKPEAAEEGAAAGEKKVIETVPTQDVIKEHAGKEGEKENVEAKEGATTA